MTSVGEMQDDETDLSSASAPCKQSKQGIIVNLSNDALRRCASQFSIDVCRTRGDSPCRCSWGIVVACVVDYIEHRAGSLRLAGSAEKVSNHPIIPVTTIVAKTSRQRVLFANGGKRVRGFEHENRRISARIPPL